MSGSIDRQRLTTALAYSTMPNEQLLILRVAAVKEELQWLMSVIDDEPQSLGEAPAIVEQRTQTKLAILSNAVDRNAMSSAEQFDAEIARLKDGTSMLTSMLSQYERNQFLDRFPDKTMLVKNLDNLAFFDGTCVGLVKNESTGKRKDTVASYHYYATNRIDPAVLHLFLYKSHKKSEARSTASIGQNFNLCLSFIDLRTPHEEKIWELTSAIESPEKSRRPYTPEGLWRAAPELGITESQQYAFLPQQLEPVVCRLRDQPEAIDGGQLAAQWRLAHMSGGEDFEQALKALNWKRELEKFVSSGDLDTLLTNPQVVAKIGILQSGKK